MGCCINLRNHSRLDVVPLAICIYLMEQSNSVEVSQVAKVEREREGERECNLYIMFPGCEGVAVLMWE